MGCTHFYFYLLNDNDIWLVYFQKSDFQHKTKVYLSSWFRFFTFRGNPFLISLDVLLMGFSTPRQAFHILSCEVFPKRMGDPDGTTLYLSGCIWYTKRHMIVNVFGGFTFCCFFRYIQRLTMTTISNKWTYVLILLLFEIFLCRIVVGQVFAPIKRLFCYDKPSIVKKTGLRLFTHMLRSVRFIDFLWLFQETKLFFLRWILPLFPVLLCRCIVAMEIVSSSPVTHKSFKDNFLLSSNFLTSSTFSASSKT